MNVRSLPSSTAIAQPISQRLLLAASSMLLGAMLIYVAGFSHLAVAHNAAHDTRHSAAFPCH